jgi:hypothetical protein
MAGEKSMAPEIADKAAYDVLNFFGYSQRIIDNVLEEDDRDIFYMLEDIGILSTEREEITLHDGRPWRINYWLLNSKKIINLANEQRKLEKMKGPREPDLKKVYGNLPEDAWINGSIK